MAEDGTGALEALETAEEAGLDIIVYLDLFDEGASFG